VYERKDTSWAFVGTFTPNLDGGAGVSSSRYSWRADWTSRAEGDSLLTIRVRDKKVKPAFQVTQHRYEIRTENPATNPFKPNGFTGRVNVFLKSGFGVRYFCARS
jgi:hypothetical protein